MSNELPTVSVVIACRNSATTLTETLEAVARQDYPGWWEVVVVDNGSSDNTVEVANRFDGRLPHLAVLRNPNPGYQARALNYGIDRSKGDVIVFLDSDDVIGDDYILHLARAMRTAPFVGAKLDIDLLNPPEIRDRRDRLQEQRIDEYCGYLPAVVGAAMGARRDALETVRGFDDTLPTQHDLDISWRLAAAGHPATFVPEATLHYRYRTTAREIFSQERGYGEGEVVLFRKFRQQGLRRRTLPRVAVSYVRTLIALVRAIRGGPDARVRAATLLGKNLGSLEGSIKHRTFFL
jgi:glycosyltransferase involved in cell wall biosynthesis